MTILRWRALLVALFMFAGTVGSMVARPTEHMADQVGMPHLDTMFPEQFGGWRELQRRHARA